MIVYRGGHIYESANGDTELLRINKHVDHLKSGSTNVDLKGNHSLGANEVTFRGVSQEDGMAFKPGEYFSIKDVPINLFVFLIEKSILLLLFVLLNLIDKGIKNLS